MENPIFVIQTSWPKVLIALFRREDGLFQFFEQVMRASGYEHNDGSGLYDDENVARADMIRYAEEYEET